MTKYNQLADGDKEIYYKSVNTRWKQLYNLEYEQGKDILNNLFFINAGAIVTIISFMATIWSEGYPSWTKSSLCYFSLGLIFVLITKAIGYHKITHLFEGWRKESTDYLNSKLDWEELEKNDKKRQGNDNIQTILAYSSFACFLLGLLNGIIFG